MAVCESHDTAGGAAHEWEIKGLHFESGPSLYAGLSPAKSPNPLKHVYQIIGEGSSTPMHASRGGEHALRACSMTSIASRSGTDAAPVRPAHVTSDDSGRAVGGQTGSGAARRLRRHMGSNEVTSAVSRKGFSGAQIGLSPAGDAPLCSVIYFCR